jgi:hypothetical protein
MILNRKFLGFSSSFEISYAQTFYIEKVFFNV